MEGIQYSGDKDLKYYEFSKNLEIFSKAYFASESDQPHHRPQLLTTADMVKDLQGIKYSFEPMTGQALEIFCEIFLVTAAESVSSLWSKGHRELQQFCVVFSIYSG